MLYFVLLAILLLGLLPGLTAAYDGFVVGA